MTAHYSAPELVFGQRLSPGDGLTSLSSILGAAEGWKVKFEKETNESLMLHSVFSFLSANSIPSVFVYLLIVLVYL